MTTNTQHSQVACCVYTAKKKNQPSQVLPVIVAVSYRALITQACTALILLVQFILSCAYLAQESSNS